MRRKIQNVSYQSCSDLNNNFIGTGQSFVLIASAPPEVCNTCLQCSSLSQRIVKTLQETKVISTRFKFEENEKGSLLHRPMISFNDAIIIYLLCIHYNNHQLLLKLYMQIKMLFNNNTSIDIKILNRYLIYNTNDIYTISLTCL